MDGFLGNFSGGVCARTKHVGRACGDLSGQSMILEVVHGNCPEQDGV